jgi:GNAT superfamily N-acetyltransferase
MQSSGTVDMRNPNLARETKARSFQTVLLSSDDVDEVFALYQLARSVTPHGFLAIRTKDDYRKIFQNPKHMVGLGIKDADRLIAYSVCHRIIANPHVNNPILSSIDATLRTVYHGDGHVIHPGYQGRGIGRQLLQFRSRQLADRGVQHYLALVAVDNLPSIGNIRNAGSMLVGFARDETALNYIVYSGCVRERVMTNALPVLVSYRDRNQQNRLFAQRHVICDVSHPAGFELGASRDDSEIQFHFLPVE